MSFPLVPKLQLGHALVPEALLRRSLPHGLAFGADGNLYVASFNNARVTRFDPTTGAYLGDFVAAGSGRSFHMTPPQTADRQFFRLIQP